MCYYQVYFNDEQFAKLYVSIWQRDLAAGYEPCGEGWLAWRSLSDAELADDSD